MGGKQAKVLSAHQVEKLLVFCLGTRNAERNHVLVLLSIKAGLRAGEIANLTWDMVTDPSGEIGTLLELHDCAAKKGSGRRIPLNIELQQALVYWRRFSSHDGPVIRSERGRAMTPRSIVNWFAQAYRTLNLVGCSSHSGRRTFITR